MPREAGKRENIFKENWEGGEQFFCWFSLKLFLHYWNIIYNNINEFLDTAKMRSHKSQKRS